MIAVAIVAALLLSPTPFADRDGTTDPCTENLQDCGAAVVSTRSDFRGAIIVPGSDAANAAVARSGGCEGCDWTLVLSCDENDFADPEYLHCNGARCPDGSLYRLYLQRPGDAAPGFVDTVCLTVTRRIVEADEVAVDVERHLTALAPPPTSIAVQPDERAVTRLPTYFVAEGPGGDRTTLDVATAAGPARLAIEIAPSEYRWEFGDGATCVTTTPGGRHERGTQPAERCDDRVAHAYALAGAVTVRLTTVWRGTFTFDVGFGPVGPRAVPGNGVAGPPATRALRLREARAELIGR